MRRAITWTCTQVTSRPSRRAQPERVALVRERRLVERGVDEKRPKVPALLTVPSTGERFECTLNTFMNTLTMSASRSSHGRATC